MEYKRKIDDLNFKREEDRKCLIEHKKKIDDLNVKNLEFEMYINELLEENKSQKNEIEYLNKKVAHLIKFEFEVKLRKLQKNLI